MRVSKKVQWFSRCDSHNIEWVNFDIVSSPRIDYLSARLSRIHAWGALSRPLAELSKWQNKQGKDRRMKSAMLVIDIVSRGGTVGFWDVRVQVNKGAKWEGGITWSRKACLPIYNQSLGIPLHQLTNPRASVWGWKLFLNYSSNT